MEYVLSTPERKSKYVEFSGFSNSKLTSTCETAINYKSKTYELMKEITEMQIKEKGYIRSITALKKEQQVAQKELRQFLAMFDASSLNEVRVRLQSLTGTGDQNTNRIIGHSSLAFGEESEEQLQKQGISHSQSAEYERIIAEYKEIIRTQETKVLQYQQKCKTKQRALKDENEQLKTQVDSLSQQMAKAKQNLQEQLKEARNSQSLEIEKLKGQLCDSLELNSELKAQAKNQSQDLQQLKNEFRDLLLEKQTLDEKYNKLKMKYRDQIDHFETIEREVEVKLVEVEKEIAYYKEERNMHLEKIARLTHELREADSREEKTDFSFGEDSVNAATQTDALVESDNQEEGALQNLNAECYEISIRSLLEENNRLKKTLVALSENYEAGSEIPAEIKLEIKLLKGVSASDLHPTKTQYAIDEIEETVEKEQKPRTVGNA